MKKVISIILCVVLAFGCCTVGFARTENYPILIIEGIQVDQQFLDYGTENQRNTISAINIPTVVFEVVKAIVFSSILQDKQVFVDGFCSAAKEALKYFSCDKDGNSVYEIQTDKFPLAISNYENYPKRDDCEPGLLADAIERYGADMCYYYRYDWRLDPLDNADEINALVETAKSDHGCDRVNIISASMGGINALCYLAKYGSDSVNNCVFLSSTFFGTYVASDLLQGKVDFNDGAVYNYAASLVKDIPVVGALLKAVYKTGLLGFACNFLNGFVEDNKAQIYDEVLRDCFATMPALWAVTLPEEYDDCIDNIFHSDELKAEYAGVIRRADALHEVGLNRENILDSAVENGMHLYIVASYGLPPIPAYERAVTQGDSILESAPMLGNATVADYGTTFPEDYQPLDPSLVSPDRIVDLSTAAYPQYTWAIRDAMHVPCRTGAQTNEFLFTLLESDTQLTADSLEDYPQFLRTDENLDFIL